jgi:hypothetical protein
VLKLQADLYSLWGPFGALSPAGRLLLGVDNKILLDFVILNNILLSIECVIILSNLAWGLGCNPNNT